VCLLISFCGVQGVGGILSNLHFLTLSLAAALGAQAQNSGAAFNLPPCAGDSATDDTPILWNAMRQSSSSIFFLSPSRTCYVNFAGPFRLPVGIKLIGTPGRSILRPYTTSKSLAQIDNSDITFEGLTFDAHAPVISGTQDSLIFVMNASRVNLVNNRFLPSPGGSMQRGNAVWYYNSSGRIQDNDFSDFRNQIIVRAASGLNPEISITGNHLHDNSVAGGNAIAISNDGGSVKVDLPAVIEANTIQNIHASSSSTGQDGNAVDIYLANHVRVSNNHVENVAFSCYRSASSDDAAFTANYCAGTGETAAYSEFTSTHNQWLNNYFANAHGACLNLTNLNVGGEMHTAIGNHMLKCGSSGIHAEGNAVVYGNTIDQSGNGVLIGYGSYGVNVLVKDNLITDTSGSNITQFGIGVEAGANSGVQIEGNRIDLGANWIITTEFGAPSSSTAMPPSLTVRNQALTFAMLGSPSDGSLVYCPNCRPTPVCLPNGGGAFAKRVSGAWVCQ